MNIPREWSTAKRPKAPPGRHEHARKKQRLQHTHPEPTSIVDLASEICKHILDANPSKVAERLSFDTVLSNVSYRQILESLYASEGAPVADVPVLSKSYEESYMREAVGMERRCVMGTECECMLIDRTNAFVGTELLLPGQSRADLDPQMCVLCCRKHTQKLYYDMLYSPTTLQIGLIQRYGVIVDAVGEYARDSTLIMPPSGPVHMMPFPSPDYCRAHYSVHVRNTLRYVIQNSGLGFQEPPHGGASAASERR